jgi:flagellar motor switch protein FliM
MGDEILSSEELEALMSPVEGAAAGRGKREKRVSEYDFVRPNKLSGGQLQALQRLHETMAQGLTAALSSYLRLALEVSIISLGELTFEVFRNSLPTPTLINVLSLAPLQDRAVATMDMKLAFSLLDRMLGGPGRPLDKVRALTTIEQSLLDNLMRRFLEQLAQGWRGALEFAPAVEARETDPQSLQVIPSGEMVLVATFSLAAPGEIEAGEMCFCLPFTSLEGRLGRLGDPSRFTIRKRDQTPVQRKHLDRVVKQSTLEVSCALGTTALSVGEVMDLAPGDVLVLDQRHDGQLAGFVAGLERLAGRPGRLGRKVGFLIERVIPAGKSPLDRE